MTNAAVVRAARWVALGAVALGCQSASGQAARPPAERAQGAKAQPVRVLPSPALAKVGDASIADVVDDVVPSVVSVSSTRVSRASDVVPPMFRRFGPGGGEEFRQEGLGSGVVVRPDIVVTNNHVVEDATEVKVATADGREFDAKVVGTDPKSDLAVLKVDGAQGKLRPLKFGDSSRLRLGDVVLAIGNPFGVGQTVTMGIVSAKGRADVGIVDYEDFIQTDAAINPGNSGGALVDMEGRLVGINTAILSRTGGSMGIGFAIPSGMAQPIVDSLIDHGKVQRGWLGVTIQDVDRELAEAMKLSDARGVLIADVHRGSPAERAGVQRGDVVITIDGQTVDSTGRLRNVVAAAGAKHSVQMELLRNGKKQTLTVKLGESPDKPRASLGSAPGRSPGAEQTPTGARVEPLSPELRRKFRIGNDVSGGVVITGIARGSAAARAGLRPGDVVLEVNRRKVGDAQAFSQAFANAKGRTLLLIHRNGSTLFLVVKR